LCSDDAGSRAEAAAAAAAVAAAQRLPQLLDADTETQLARLLYNEHYSPLDKSPEASKKGMYAARTELRWLTEWALDLQMSDDRRRSAMKRAVLERVDFHKPLSYIVGWQPFLDAHILCEHPVLIPRPETEQWALWLRKLLESDKDCTGPIEVLDLCCGTGCVGVSLAKIDPRVSVTAVDVSAKAVDLTERNFKHNGILSERWSVIQGDMFKALGEKPEPRFDMIVSNPPYIFEDSYAALPETVSRWEDRLALVGDKRHRSDPLAYYRELCIEAKLWLRPSTVRCPSVAFEVGEQADLVGRMFEEKGRGWTDVELHSDYGGEPRWLVAALE
jgi:HemK-like putative methylase